MKRGFLLREKPDTIPTLPIDNDPAVIQSEHVALHPAKYALTEIQKEWKQLVDAQHVTTDKRRLARACQSVVRHADVTIRTSLGHLIDNRKSIEERIASVIAPKAYDAMSVQIASEVRAHFKAMANPIAEIQKVINAKDTKTLSAILSGPCFLSGLDQASHDAVRDLARRQLCADDANAIDAIDAATARLMSCLKYVGDTLNPLVKSWLDEDEKANAAFKGLEGGQQ